MNDHQTDQCFLGPEGGIPPTKRAKLDETSGRSVGTKVGLGRKGRTVGACSLSLGARWYWKVDCHGFVRVLPMANGFHMRGREVRHSWNLISQLKSHISVEIGNQAENTYVCIIILKLGWLSLFVFGICDQKRQLDFEISYASEVWIGSLVRVNLHFT